MRDILNTYDPQEVLILLCRPYLARSDNRWIRPKAHPSAGAPEDWFYYFIPLYNSVQCMSAIFSFTCIPVNVLITVASNLIYSVVFVFILTRMFNNEHVVFGK